MKPPKYKWTAIVSWGPFQSEEVDAIANNERLALHEVRRALNAEYQPGGRILKIILRSNIPVSDDGRYIQS